MGKFREKGWMTIDHKDVGYVEDGPINDLFKNWNSLFPIINEGERIWVSFERPYDSFNIILEHQRMETDEEYNVWKQKYEDAQKKIAESKKKKNKTKEEIEYENYIKLKAKFEK